MKKAVQEKYGKLITGQSGCCESCCSTNSSDSIPSFGVGNPVELAQLNLGEKVLDIGSGAGGNCLQAAKLVGESGEVIGLDMTDEMILAANQHTSKSGVRNVRFVKGDAEKIPFPDRSFDVVISDCVINLVPSKRQVFVEIYRVLKHGGRMIISDVVTDKPLPEQIQNDEDLWCGCIAGALPEDEYMDLIRKSGLTNLEVIDKVEAEEKRGVKIFHTTYKANKV